MIFLKNSMSLRKYLIIIGIFFGVFILWINSESIPITILGSKYPVLTTDHIPSKPIFGNYKIGQIFQSEFSKLNRIDVLAADNGRVNTKDVIFHFRSTMDNNTDIVIKTINSSQIIDNRWLTVEFEPINESISKEYFFYIESPNSTYSNSISLWYTPDVKRYQGGQLIEYNTDEHIEGDLIF